MIDVDSCPLHAGQHGQRSRPFHRPGDRRVDCRSGLSSGGMRAAAAHELPSHLVGRSWPVDPPQNLREYDPEWGRAFSSGSAVSGCDHARMLSLVKVPVPVLFTHHSRHVDPMTGRVQGAISDLQAAMLCEIVAVLAA